MCLCVCVCECICVCVCKCLCVIVFFYFVNTMIFSNVTRYLNFEWKSGDDLVMSNARMQFLVWLIAVNAFGKMYLANSILNQTIFFFFFKLMHTKFQRETRNWKYIQHECGELLTGTALYIYSFSCCYTHKHLLIHPVVLLVACPFRTTITNVSSGYAKY